VRLKSDFRFIVNVCTVLLESCPCPIAMNDFGRATPRPRPRRLERIQPSMIPPIRHHKYRRSSSSKTPTSVVLPHAEHSILDIVCSRETIWQAAERQRMASSFRQINHELDVKLIHRIQNGRGRPLLLYEYFDTKSNHIPRKPAGSHYRKSPK
jgi:hypothetical protein